MNNPALAPSLQMPELGVGRLLPLTTDDYPQQRACVLYCQGCLCCESPDPAEPLRVACPGELGWREIEAFLRRRQGRLDAVVFSGDEPTLQRDLASAMQRVRELGFKVGLHSGGTYLNRFRHTLHRVDWVGFEVGSGAARQTGMWDACGWVHWASLESLIDSGIEHEVRLNWHPQLLSLDVLETVAERLRALGVRHLAIRELLEPHLPGRVRPAPRFSDVMRAEVRRRLARFWPELVWRTVCKRSS